jgi:hypothetical protein
MELEHGSPKRGPPRWIMRPAATFVNYRYNIRITQEFRWLGISLVVIFPLVAREPAHNTVCGPAMKRSVAHEEERIQCGHPWMSDLRIWVESHLSCITETLLACAFGSCTRLVVMNVRALLRNADTDSCENRLANKLLLNSSPLSYVTGRQACQVNALLHRPITRLNSIISTATDTNRIT